MLTPSLEKSAYCELKEYAVGMTVERAKRWITKQVAPTLAALVEHDGGDMGFVYEALGEGRWRYGRKQRQLLMGGV